MLSFSIIFRRFLLRFQHQQQFVIVKHNARAHFQKRVDNKSTIVDGCSTALFAAHTIDTDDMVYAVDMVYTVYMVYTVIMVYTVDMVYTVHRVYTIDMVSGQFS